MAVFAAAVVLAAWSLAAPFATVWRYSFDDNTFSARTSVNGWGSVNATPASFAFGHSHDTNYGFALAIAAAFLLAGAAAYVIGRRVTVAALPTSVGAGLVVACALLLALDRGGRDSTNTGTDSWRVGAGFWLILGAGVFATVVIVVAFVLTLLEVRTDAACAEPTPDPGPPSWWAAPDDQPVPGPPWVNPAPAEFRPPWAP